MEDLLVEEWGGGPDGEAQGEDGGEGEVFFDEEEGGEVEEQGGEESPADAPEEVGHDLGVALIFEVDPDHDEDAGKGHDGDEAGEGGVFFGQGGAEEDNGQADDDFQGGLHRVLYFLLLVGFNFLCRLYFGRF